MRRWRRTPDITVVEEFDVKDDAVRVAEIIASATQRYPDLDGWLSVGGWPVFVRNALDPVDPAKTKVVAFDTIPPAPDLLRAGKVQLLVGQKYFGWGEESVKLLKRDRRRPLAGGDLPLLGHRHRHAPTTSTRTWRSGTRGRRERPRMHTDGHG